jgi:hypothetical protein
VTGVWLARWRGRFRAVAQRKLAERTLDMEIDAGHFREQIDIGNADRTAANFRRMKSAFPLPTYRCDAANVEKCQSRPFQLTAKAVA